MNHIEATNPEANPKLNERLWQIWVCKNRELDRATAAKWWRALQVVLGMGVVALLVQSLAR